ncbi:MAG: hypothetical protein V3T59_02690 [Desulfobacterales bacterium]
MNLLIADGIERGAEDDALQAIFKKYPNLNPDKYDNWFKESYPIFQEKELTLDLKCIGLTSRILGKT